jgi:hypothetical protein
MNGKRIEINVADINKKGEEHIVYNAASEHFVEIAAGVYAKVQGDKIVIWADARKLTGSI